ESPVPRSYVPPSVVRSSGEAPRAAWAERAPATPEVRRRVAMARRGSSLFAALCLLAGLRAAFVGVPLAAPAARGARAAFDSGKVNIAGDGGAAGDVPEPMLEVNEATNAAIQDCLEEGCSVEALMSLDVKLAADESKVADTMKQIAAAQKTQYSKDNDEKLSWYGNFLSRTGALRQQLRALGGAKDKEPDFVKQLVKAASVAFGGGRAGDYPKVGVSGYSS
ncbi:unnamed protein product, partial [Prorocentrum cordatum]